MSKFMVLPKTIEGYFVFETEEDARNYAGDEDIVVEFLEIFDVEQTEETYDPQEQ